MCAHIEALRHTQYSTHAPHMQADTPQTCTTHTNTHAYTHLQSPTRTPRSQRTTHTRTQTQTGKHETALRPRRVSSSRTVCGASVAIRTTSARSCVGSGSTSRPRLCCAAPNTSVSTASRFRFRLERTHPKRKSSQPTPVDPPFLEIEIDFILAGKLVFCCDGTTGRSPVG